MFIQGKERLLYFAELFADYLKSDVDREISPAETMFNKWYMDVGVSGATCIYNACCVSWLGEVSDVLDIPCGYGRVLRHLVKLFPTARFGAADLDTKGVDFCSQRFGARPIYSEPDLTCVDFGRQYDVIWVGSLFTHVNHERTRAWLAHLVRFLSPGGIIVATFHGRYSACKGLEFGYTTQDCWEEILRGYESSGYGYADYPAAHGYVCPEGGYGVSLSRADVIVADAMAIPGVRVFGYTERGWTGHQDVLVVGKPAVEVT